MNVFWIRSLNFDETTIPRMEFHPDWERLSDVDEESDDSSLGCVKSDDESSMPDLLPYQTLKIERYERNQSSDHSNANE